MRAVEGDDMSDAGRHGARKLPQQALLAAIVDSSFDGVISKTLDGIITSWNAGAQRIFGYTEREAVGRPIAILIPADRLAEEAWILARLRAGERIESFETVRLRKDGHPIDVALTSSPLRNARGEIVGASKIVRDVSERRAAARALAESEARLAAIVDSTMDALMTVDDAGRIVVFNDAATAMLECPRDEALGTSLDRFLPARLREHLAPGAASADSGRAGDKRPMRPTHVVARRAGGGEFPAEVSLSRVVVNGEPLFTVILRDVSELSVAREARRLLEAQLREAQKMEAVGTLAGGIAHDVNNALGSILGNVALAREDLPAGHPALRSIEQIGIAAQRARGVVRQILAFSRRQAQELVVQPVAPMMEEAIGLLRATLPSVVRLEIDVGEPGLQVSADANQIHQVLLNLCTNAWHALRGSTGRIVVGAGRVVLDAGEALRLGELQAGPHVRLSVADNGCGMDAKTRSRIFEPFFTTKARGEGTGLGLSVVHGIVHAHGGAIAVESEPGRGTQFSIYLPQVVPVGSTAGLPQAAVLDDGGGMRIACVDDDEVMLLMVERLLKRRGFEVQCHDAPEKLLACVRAAPGDIDVVVSDFNMPGMTGIELARELAAIAPALPVVVSSGYVSEALQASAHEAGVRALLEKEDLIERLVATILRLLRGQDS